MREVLSLLVRVGMAALVLGLCSWSASAQNCSNGQVPSMSVSSMNAGAYDPFGTPTPLTVTVTVTTTQSCALALTFSRATLPAVMTAGADSLQYQIEAVGGGASYLTTVLPPLAANRLNFTAPAAGTHTVQVQLRILTGQIVSFGSYSDIGVTARIYNRRNNGTLQLRRSVAVTSSATVPRICRLDAPAPATLSWVAAEIPEGTPDPSIVKSTTMTAACTAPTILRLTGSALTPTPAVGPVAGFDNFINYRAVGTFGAATSTLVTTTTPASADSPTRNVASGATVSGTVSMNINLIAGLPVIAGNYSGVLTVTIDPSP